MVWHHHLQTIIPSMVRPTPQPDFLKAGREVLLHLVVQRYGGHVGFVDIAPFRMWLDQAILTVLADHRRPV